MTWWLAVAGVLLIGSMLGVLVWDCREVERRKAAGEDVGEVSMWP